MSWAGGASQAPATIRPVGHAGDGTSGAGGGHGQDRPGAGHWLSVVRTASGGMLRHKVQAVVIVAVLFIATASATLGLALLNANNSPFTRAFAAQHGADVTVTANPGHATAAQFAATAHIAGVTALAGPFGETTTPLEFQGQSWGPTTLVGRSDPGGPVDDVVLNAGHWADGQGQVVLAGNPAQGGGGPDNGGPALGSTITATSLPGKPALTVVGFANSVTDSTDSGGWVTPSELSSLLTRGSQPTAQLLYRFTNSATNAQLQADAAAVTKALPAGTVIDWGSWLTAQQSHGSNAAIMEPFVLAFALIGLVMAVLIVGNVISGAVIAQYQRIGVLKSLGLTPAQVVAVYLSRVGWPALVGCLVGVVGGYLLSVPVLHQSAGAYDVGRQQVQRRRRPRAGPSRCGHWLSVVRTASGGMLRHKVQAVVIVAVLFIATASATLGLALLNANNSPFTRAFAAQHGADVTVTANPGHATAAQFAATAHIAGVTALAGPFGETTTPLEFQGQSWGPTTLVGRSDPGGPVDDVVLNAGHWADGQGQVVLAGNPAQGGGGPDNGGPALGSTITATSLPGKPVLTVVGFANSVTDSTDSGGWVTPSELSSLLARGSQPTAQLLYRFTNSATNAQLQADAAAVTKALPAGTVIDWGSWLTAQQSHGSNAAIMEPFVLAFALIGLVMAVLIVGNVISGAVIAQYQRIGVLKSLGLTPAQVVAVYLSRVGWPALGGCLVGVVGGYLLSVPVLHQSAGAYDVGRQQVPLWALLLAPAGMLAITLLAALGPALRAGGCPPWKRSPQGARPPRAGATPSTGWPRGSTCRARSALASPRRSPGPPAPW